MFSPRDVQTALRELAILRDQGQGLQAAEQAAIIAMQCEEANEHLLAARAWQEVGVSNKVAGFPEKALQVYPKAIKHYQMANEPFGPGRSERDMAIALFDLGRHDEALQHIKTSIATLKEAAVAHPGPYANAELGISLAKHGMLLVAQKHYQAAQSTLDEALTLVQRGKTPAYETTTLLHIAECAHAQKDHTAAVNYVLAALGLIYAHNEQERHPRRIGECHYSLARCYLQLQNPERAQYHLTAGQQALAHMSSQAQHVIEQQLDVARLRQQLQVNA